MMDQASSLRSMINRNRTIDELTQVEKKAEHYIKIYSVVSGKGGVGKTNFSINMAIKFQQMGKRVLLLDADLGMCNANIMLGMETKLSLIDLIQGRATLDQIITKGPSGIHLISGGADLLSLKAIEDIRQQEIVDAMSQIMDYDILIIDIGAGITKYSLTFIQLSHEVIIITTPEPTAITDAYRIVKAIAVYKLKEQVKVVVNQIHDLSQGEEAFQKLFKTSSQFLHMKLQSIGFIFYDTRVRKSIMEQIPVVLKYPNGLASQNIKQICENILEDKEYSYKVSNFKQLSNKLLRIFG